MGNQKTPGNQGAIGKSTMPNASLGNRGSLRTLLSDLDERNGRTGMALFLLATVAQFLPWGLSLWGIGVNHVLGSVVISVSTFLYIAALYLLWGIAKQWAVGLAMFAAVVGGWIGYKVFTGGYEPVLEARLAYADPSIVIMNNTDVVAHDMRYSVYLWNLDHTDNLDALPILTPIPQGTFVRAHERFLPTALFDSPAVKARIRTGDRLWGFINVTCSDCSETKVYFMGALLGSGGWLSEVNVKDPRWKGMSIKDLIAMVPIIAKNADVELEKLCPSSTRIYSVSR
jgi:hypothetical protein